jgi:hypothetical protein
MGNPVSARTATNTAFDVGHPGDVTATARAASDNSPAQLNRPGNYGDPCSGHLAVGGLLMVALLELHRWLVLER